MSVTASICSKETLEQLISATFTPNPHAGFVRAAGSSLPWLWRHRYKKRSFRIDLEKAFCTSSTTAGRISNHPGDKWPSPSTFSSNRDFLYCFFWWGQWGSQTLTKSLSFSPNSQEISASLLPSPPALTQTGQNIPEPNTAACERGTGLLSPTFKQTPRGVYATRDYRCPPPTKRVVRLTSTQRQEKMKKYWGSPAFTMFGVDTLYPLLYAASNRWWQSPRHLSFLLRHTETNAHRH